MLSHNDHYWPYYSIFQNTNHETNIKHVDAAGHHQHDKFAKPNTISLLMCASRAYYVVDVNFHQSVVMINKILIVISGLAQTNN